METSASRELHSGITCIDADYMGPGIACFYLLEHAGECALIETGTSLSFDRLRAVMRARNIQPAQVRYVIPTHVHLDHAGGAGRMMAAFPQAQLLVHPRGLRHLVEPGRLVDSAIGVYGQARFTELYGEILPVPHHRARAMDDGESISLAGRKLEFRHTRGHADHHFCVWDEATRGWFSGDTFGLCYPWAHFPGGDFLFPTTTPTQFDPQACLASLDLLASYGPRRMYLTHFGELEFAPGQVAALGELVMAFAAAAVAASGDLEALPEALSDLCVARVRQLAPDYPESRLRQLLDFDMGLNAQGLSVWLGRRDRGRSG